MPRWSPQPQGKTTRLHPHSWLRTGRFCTAHVWPRTPQRTLSLVEETVATGVQQRRRWLNLKTVQTLERRGQLACPGLQEEVPRGNIRPCIQRGWTQMCCGWCCVDRRDPWRNSIGRNRRKDPVKRRKHYISLEGVAGTQAARQTRAATGWEICQRVKPQTRGKVASRKRQHEHRCLILSFSQPEGPASNKFGRQ